MCKTENPEKMDPPVRKSGKSELKHVMHIVSLCSI